MALFDFKKTYPNVMIASCSGRANSIVPGPCPNPAGQGTNTDFVQKFRSKVPLNHVGKAEQIVGVVVFLALDATSFITGAELAVDSGRTAW